jgi:uncharacterized protein YbjT (DUF2867 family)
MAPRKLLVLGATGGTGRSVVEQALAAGPAAALGAHVSRGAVLARLAAERKR